MALLQLRISVGDGVVRAMQFDPMTVVFDACRLIREKIPEANEGNGKHWTVHCDSFSHLFALGLFGNARELDTFACQAHRHRN